MGLLRISGGRVLRPDHAVERADVIVDQSAGEIVAVGSPEEASATVDEHDEVEVLDASDGLVIPGLVNAHCHVAMTLLRGYADDKPLDRWLQEDVWPVEAALEPADVEAGARLGVLEMIRSGTTAFADMYFEMDRVANVVEGAGLRAVLGYGAITVGTDEEEAHEELERSLAFAREYDGAADGRISTAVMPHSLTTVGEAYYREHVPDARAADLPIHLHANETADEVEPIVDEHGRRPLSYAADLGLLEERDFLAHCVHVDEAELALLAERGTGVVHCPASNMKLASGMAPVQAMLDRGIEVAIGTDGAASNNDLDLFDELRDAAMLGKLAADDAAAVDADDAVRMATQGGASVLGIDAGRVEAGAAADLAILDLEAAHLTPRHDLVSHLAYAARGSDVRHTVCDGRVLMRDREVTCLDATRTRRRAEERAADLLERAEA